VDEQADLCLGHIVNKAFPLSKRTTVVQRSDVDNFYGSVIEADFELAVSTKDKTIVEVLTDPTLKRKLNPRIVVDGEEWRHYDFMGKKAKDHTLLRMETNDGKVIEVVLPKSITEVVSARQRRWRWVAERDCRIPALAALIKAAHLTLFHHLGYSYALSAAGEYMGRQILGNFFRETSSMPMRQARAHAVAYFQQFVHMARPIRYEGAAPVLGTVEDNQVLSCHGSEGRPFATIVFIRTASAVHAVMVPASSDPDAVAHYLRFLKSSQEAVAVKRCYFDKAGSHWKTSFAEPTLMIWPKNHDSFVFA